MGPGFPPTTSRIRRRTCGGGEAKRALQLTCAPVAKRSWPYSSQAHLRKIQHTYELMFITICRLTPALQADQRSRTTHTHTTRCALQVPARCPTDAAWLGAPVPTVLFAPPSPRRRWPPPRRRWPPPHRRWPQPSDSAGSLSECKGRREQRGEEDQSAEGGSVVKRTQVQKVAVAPAICYTRCALCRPLHPDPTHKTGRATMGQRWKPGWSYVPSSCVPCANIKKKIKGQM